MTETADRIQSVHLQNERTVWIRKPANPSNSDVLTVFLDGEFYRERVGAVSVIEELLSSGSIADSWFVFVSSESVEARWKECPCHGPFAKFVVEELLAWLELRDPCIRSASQKVLVGLSYTGLAAAFIAAEHPGVFQKVISQSGSFWFNDEWITREYQSLEQRIPTAFYLDVGLKETQTNVRHKEDVLQVVSQIDGVRGFRDVLIRRGVTVSYVEFDGGHDFEAWRGTLPGALKWALPNHSRSKTQ